MSSTRPPSAPDGRRLGPSTVALAAVLAAAAAPMGILGGCRTGPDAPPATEAPAADALASPESPAVTAAPVDPRWWESMNDPVLDALVADAEAGSQSLAAALAAVRAAYAGLGIAEAELWPSAALGGEYARIKTNIARLASQGVELEPYDMYAYGVGMPAWEIDLWGGVRRQVEAVRADAAAEVELLRGALVSVRTQVAANYAQLRMLGRRRAVLVDNIDAMTRTRDAIAARLEAGTVTELDLARAEVQLDAALAELPSIDAAERAAFAALAVLCGTTPAGLEARHGAALRDAGAVPVPPDVVGIGLPAELVTRRPDVRRSWQRLVAATASIGVAEAERLPKLTISGNFYIASTSLSGLGDYSNRAYSIGPSLSLPLFAGGALVANVERAKATADAALGEYRETLLEAIGDLSASVGGYLGAREAVVLSARAAESAGQALALAEAQFDAGVIDITDLLDVQRAALTTEDSAAEAQGAQAQAYISLCRALGGGWSDADLERAAEEAAKSRGVELAFGAEADGRDEPAEQRTDSRQETVAEDDRTTP